MSYTDETGNIIGLITLTTDEPPLFQCDTLMTAIDIVLYISSRLSELQTVAR